MGTEINKWYYMSQNDLTEVGEVILIQLLQILTPDKVGRPTKNMRRYKIYDYINKIYEDYHNPPYNWITRRINTGDPIQHEGYEYSCCLLL